MQVLLPRLRLRRLRLLLLSLLLLLNYQQSAVVAALSCTAWSGSCRPLSSLVAPNQQRFSTWLPAQNQRSCQEQQPQPQPQLLQQQQQQQQQWSVSPRRHFVHSVAAAVVSLTATLVTSSPAHATYSAYTRREQDWEHRLQTNQVQISSPRSLRRQLHDIAPMNTASSKVFCPNGPTSNVSPLMENKCDDTRLARPSVYGRTEDSVGNSIPGFAGGFYSAGSSGSRTSSSSSKNGGSAMPGSNFNADQVGGFPSYKFK